MRREHILSVVPTCLTILLLVEEISRTSSSSDVRSQQSRSYWCQNQCKVCANETIVRSENSNVHEQGDICRCCSSNVVFREKGESCGSQLSFRSIDDESSPITILSTTWCKGDLVCTNSICRDSNVQLSKGSSNLTLLLSGEYSSRGIQITRNSEKLPQGRKKRSIEHRHSINGIGMGAKDDIEQSNNTRLDKDDGNGTIQFDNVNKTISESPSQIFTDNETSVDNMSNRSNSQEDYKIPEVKYLLTTPNSDSELFAQKSQNIFLQVKPRPFKYSSFASRFASNDHLGKLISIRTTYGEYQLIYSGDSALADLAILLTGLSSNSFRGNCHEIFKTFQDFTERKSEIHVFSEFFSTYSNPEHNEKSGKTDNFPLNINIKQVNVFKKFDRRKRQTEEFSNGRQNDTIDVSGAEYNDDMVGDYSTDEMEFIKGSEQEKPLSIESLPTFNESFEDRSTSTVTPNESMTDKHNDFMAIDETRGMPHTFESSGRLPSSRSIYAAPDFKDVRGDLPFISDPASAIAELLPVEDAKRMLSNVDFKNPVNRWLTLWAYANVVQHETHFREMQTKLDILLQVSSNNTALLQKIVDSLPLKPVTRKSYKIHPLTVEEDFDPTHDDTELIFPDQSTQARWDFGRSPIPENKYERRLADDFRFEADIQTKGTLAPENDGLWKRKEIHDHDRIRENKQSRTEDYSHLKGTEGPKLHTSNQHNFSRITTGAVGKGSANATTDRSQFGKYVTSSVWSLSPIWNKPLQIIEKPKINSRIGGGKDDLLQTDETKLSETKIPNPSDQPSITQKIEYKYNGSSIPFSNESQITKTLPEKKQRKGPSWKMFVSGKEVNRIPEKNIPDSLIHPLEYSDDVQNFEPLQFAGSSIYSSEELLENPLGMRNDFGPHLRLVRDFHEQIQETETPEVKNEDNSEYILSIKDYDDQVARNKSAMYALAADLDNNESILVKDHFPTTVAYDSIVIPFERMKRESISKLSIPWNRGLVDYVWKSTTPNYRVKGSNFKVIETVKSKPLITSGVDEDFAHINESEYDHEEDFDISDTHPDDEADYINPPHENEEYSEEYRAIGAPRKNIEKVNLRNSTSQKSTIKHVT